MTHIDIRLIFIVYVITFLLQKGYNKYSIAIQCENNNTYVQVIKIKYILVSTIGWSITAHDCNQCNNIQGFYLMHAWDGPLPEDVHVTVKFSFAKMSTISAQSQLHFGD